ncbi:DUF2207 domain-containing protein [Amycolatopsis anabasis]|uniref:DUF2207 domain-containing protein n=1 Tax=Amycolatopsis anabasis TaxID=1840409 RepID=UPI001FEBB9BF|nr:DUF2207 domain-containing protein [Amycolatopsis anabasis]
MFRNLGVLAAAATLATVSGLAAQPVGTTPTGEPPAPSRADVAPSTAPDALLKQQAPTAPVVVDSLKVQRDGALAVTEKITVPGGQELARRVPLRVPADDDRDRIYTVRDAKAEGAATVETADGQFVVHARGGESTVTYTVDGAVADLADQQQVRWQVASGWDADLSRLQVSFIAPAQSSTTDCFAGPIGSSARCTLAEVDHTGIVRVDQDGVRAGDRVDLVVGLPAGTVPANARFEQVASVATAFALTPVTAIGLGILVLLLAAGFAVLWWLRRRDARALAAGSGPVEVLMRDGDRVSFASPDGVLPGQVGTVVDGTVDVVDVSATVVDLAVRNYLWLAEIPGPNGFADWQLSRRNPPDEHLHDFERAVFETLLPAGRDTALLSELRSGGALDLTPVREAMYADVVRQRWFTRRPDLGRNSLTWAGIAVAALGVLGTAALAFTVGHALLGVAVALAGIALAAGASWLPSRTARGRLLAGQVRGLLQYLHTADPVAIPPADREMVFSRSLPYAVVLGETERWLEAFAALDPAADGSPGLYWFGGLEGDANLQRFRSHFPAFLTALDGLLAEAGHLRSIRPTGDPVPA